MVTHHCFRCGKNWSRKAYWRKHLNTQKICSVHYLDIERTEIENNYNAYLDDFLTMKEDKEKKYQCDNCSFSTKHKKSLRRHITTKVCTKNKNVNELELENQLLRQQIELLSTLNSSNTNINDHSTNTTINDNSRNNNYNIVNNYGNEDLSNISMKRLEEIGMCPPEAIPRLIEEIHFNVPGNRNIAIPNIRANYAQVYQNGKWVYVDLPKLLDDLLTNNHDRFEDLIKYNRNSFTQKWVNGIDTMLTKVDEDDKVKAHQKRKIKHTIINNRK